MLRRFPDVRAALDTILAEERVRVGLERGMIRSAPLMWPRFAATLHIDGKAARIEIERTPALGETIQYYEFTLDVIQQAEAGELNLKAAGGL